MYTLAIKYKQQVANWKQIIMKCVQLVNNKTLFF